MSYRHRRHRYTISRFGGSKAHDPKTFLGVEHRRLESNDRCSDLLVFVFSSNLHDQVNDTSPELGVLDAHEGFRERKPIRRG
jgi:hypothetical protein